MNVGELHNLALLGGLTGQLPCSQFLRSRIAAPPVPQEQGQHCDSRQNVYPETCPNAGNILIQSGRIALNWMLQSHTDKSKYACHDRGCHREVERELLRSEIFRRCRHPVMSGKPWYSCQKQAVHRIPTRPLNTTRVKLNGSSTFPRAG
jgi:hypothetical protein